jgi:hypothetical protein
MRRRVVAGLAGLVSLSCLVACTPGGVDTPTPTPSAPSATPTPSVSPTPSPSPSLSPSEQAAKDASTTFEEYIRATNRLAQRGGADTLPADLVRLTTGPERASSLAEARKLKSDGFKRLGEAQLKNVGVTRVNGSNPNITGVVLAACLDQTKVTVTKNGAPYSRTPKYVVFTKVTMVLKASLWLVYRVESAALDGGRNCENY